MIGLDTNILVRYFMRDDQGQASAAKRLVEDARARGERLFINRIVLCELTWVLSKLYRRSHAEIADAVERILVTTQFEVEGKDAVWEALRAFRGSAADFADCLIGASSSAAGCTSTATFDKKAGKLEAFLLLAP